MAAFVGVLMMVCIVNVLVLVHLSIVIMSMLVLIIGMTTHWLSPPPILDNQFLQF
jgi:hypothetical protein